MSDTDTGTSAEEIPDPGSEGDEATGSETVDFKAEAEKWKALSRKHEQQAKANAAAAKRIAEMEEANKTEEQKRVEALTAAEKRAADAEAKALRLEVAHEKSIPAKLLKFLTGGTREEIEASADELLEAISPADKGGNDGPPKERLRGGAAPQDEPTEMDPAKLAAQIGRM